MSQLFCYFCEKVGIMSQSALNISTIEVPAKDDAIAKGREAFYKMRQAAAEAGIQDMPLDEINEEICVAKCKDNEDRQY